jgi:hypothetical protein
VENKDRVPEIIRRRLEALTDHLRGALKEALDEPPVGPGEPLTFEVCPYFFGTTLAEAERTVLPAELVEEIVLGESVCREAGVEVEEYDYDGALSAAFLGWLADGWQEAGGDQSGHPGEAFFHGYHLDRFDLAARAWRRVEGRRRDVG